MSPPTSRQPTPNHARQRRLAMVAHDLRRGGIRDESVLAAMARVPREEFLPDEFRSQAYDNCALPIACGQTISQPLIVAMMTEALKLRGGERVLEIGAGSGYQAAVLAELAGEVISLERHPELADAARRRLQRLGYENVRVVLADGSWGLPDEAPFDCIIVTAAAEACPPALLEQLGMGGRLVGPFGPADGQVLQVIKKTPAGFAISNLTSCRFVPLVSDSSTPRRH